MFSRLRNINSAFKLSKNTVSYFSNKTKLLSASTHDFYESRLNEAKGMYDDGNLEGAKTLLRTLWEQFPQRDEAYQFHHQIIVNNTQFPFYGKEYTDLLAQRSQHFPEQTESAKQRLYEELERLNNAPATPSFKK